MNELWPHLGGPGGPAGTSVTRQVPEELGFFTGLGPLIVFFAALALGRRSMTTVPAEGPDTPAEVATDSFPAGKCPDPAATISVRPAPQPHQGTT